MRQETARALGDLTDLRAVAPLIAALEDSAGRTYDDESLAYEAIRSLGELGDGSAAAPIVEWLRGGCRYPVIADTLISFGAASVAPLISLLNDPKEWSRPYIIEMLVRIGDVRAISPLQELLDDDEHHVREATMDALVALGDTSLVDRLVPMLNGNDEVAANAVGRLGKLGQCAVEPLVSVLRDGPPYLHCYAVIALGDTRSPQAVPALIEQLRNETTCCQAAKSLGKLGYVSAVPALIEQLWNETTCCQAAESLGKLGDVSAVPALIEVLSDPAVSVQAVEALGQLRDRRAVQPLIPMLGRHLNYRIRSAVAKALGEIGDPTAISPLRELLHDREKNEWSYCHLLGAAAMALSQLDDFESAPLIIARCQDPGNYSGLTIAALRRMHTPEEELQRLGGIDDDYKTSGQPDFLW